MEECISDFQCVFAQMNNVALKQQFHLSLLKQLKNELAWVGIPVTFNGLTRLANQINHIFKGQNQEKMGICSSSRFTT